MRNVYLLSAPPSPLKRQPSKESVNSVTRSTGSGAAILPEESNAVDEELIVTTTAPSSLTGSPQLIHRNPNSTSSAGDAKLGRIQLSIRYSVQRQKLVITVHKIAYVHTENWRQKSWVNFLLELLAFAVTYLCHKMIRTTYRIRM